MAMPRGPFRNAILQEREKSPFATAKEIAAATGAKVPTVYGVLARDRELQRCRALGQAEKAAAAKKVEELYVSGDATALATRSFELVRSQAMSEAYRKMDKAAVLGAGDTSGFADSELQEMLDGVCAMVLGMFSDLAASQSQVVWDTRAREIALCANFIAGSIVPLAKRGTYRGMKGNEFFARLASYMKRRVAAGVLG